MAKQYSCPINLLKDILLCFGQFSGFVIKRGDMLMKLAFSTLGCPDFDWSDIYSMAKDFGFQGIEMRGLGHEIFAVNARPFRPDNIAKTVEHLKRMHLEICCLSSGCALKYADKKEETCREIKEYIETILK